MDRKQVLVGVATLALLLVSAAGWYWWKSARDLELARQLQADVFSQETRSLPEEERRAKFTEYRKQYERLSDDQKRQLRRQSHSGMQQRMTERIDQFFALPQPQRVAFLDKQINEMEKRRKQFSSRSIQQGPGGRPDFGRGRGNRGNSSQAERGERRDRWRRERLDHSTPEQRAKFAEYIEALRKRREQRGTPSSGRGPRLVTGLS